MSVLQSKQNEIRYIKRQNLEEESKLYANMFRDIIHNYGIDCKYYKMKIPYPELFKNTINDNNVILHAYGVDPDPKYPISADILSYLEVGSDQFQLNGYGNTPNMDVTFTFDRTEFATKLAYKLGQYKEFKIKERNIVIEVPMEYKHITYINENGVPMHYTVNDNLFEYVKCLGIPATFECPELNMTGSASFTLGRYELNKLYDVPVESYIHTDGGYKFPVNEHIYRSFYYNVDINEYIDVFLFLRYKIQETIIGKDGFGGNIKKRILHGKLHGTVLFRDLHEIGKYMDLIHPDVGDIVSIDFPDETNREQYEITECMDRNLGSDGINPLLHKYIWKCKARRYINSGEDSPEYNESNARLMETLDLVQQNEEELVKQFSKYDSTHNDAVYGGFEKVQDELSHDIKKVDFSKVDQCKTKFIDDGSFISIHIFGDGSKIVTDGFDLFYINRDNMQKQLSFTETQEDQHPDTAWVQSGLEYLAATEDQVWFKNFDNDSYMICKDPNVSPDEKEMCLNSLVDTTYSTGDINHNGDMFYKFKNCGTILLSVGGELYCRFGNKERNIVRLG